MDTRNGVRTLTLALPVGHALTQPMAPATDHREGLAATREHGEGLAATREPVFAGR